MSCQRRKFQVNLFGRTVNVWLQKASPSWVSDKHRNKVGCLDVVNADYRIWVWAGGSLQSAIDTWRHEFGHVAANVVDATGRPHLMMEWFADLVASAVAEYERGVKIIKEAYRG